MSFKYLSFALLFTPIMAHSDSEATLNEVFTAYRNANNQAFVTGDVTYMKKLYSGDIDSCWTKNNINYINPAISLHIPDNAKYTLTELNDTEYNPFKEAGFIFHKEPTHRLDISYKKTYFDTCSNTTENPSTSIATFVHLNNNSFTFPGICPSKDFLESRVAKGVDNIPRLMSQPFIDHVLSSLTEKEKNTIKQYGKDSASIKKFRNEMNAISKKYRTGPATRREVRYELCKK